MYKYDGPPIRNVYEPTGDEIRAWAYSGADFPEQDWDIFMAEPEHLELLVRLLEDPASPARRSVLGSLYCTVGHTDHTDPRIAAAIDEAGRSTEPWLTTWARRSRHAIENPEDFDRDDWCGLETLASRPVD